MLLAAVTFFGAPTEAVDLESMVQVEADVQMDVEAASEDTFYGEPECRPDCGYRGCCGDRDWKGHCWYYEYTEDSRCCPIGW